MSAEVKAAVTTFLNTERNDVKLPKIIVDALVVYIVDLNGMEVDDVSEVDERFIEFAEEAYKAKNQKNQVQLPKLLEDRVRAWVGAVAQMPHVKESSGAVLAGKEAPDDTGDEVIFGEVDVREMTLTEYRAEKVSQGLTGVQMLVLSLALELGRVVAPGTFLGDYVWGASPAMSSLARQQKKAGVETLTQILQDKDRRSVRPRLVAFFGSITRDFSELGELNIATRLARFWSDTSTVSANDEVMCSYLKEWMRKYGGKGIPELCDLKIATRVAGEVAVASGMSDTDRTEIKAAKDAAKLAQQEAAASRAEMRQMRTDIAAMKSKGPAGGPPGKGKGAGKGAGGKGRCFICGDEGHQVDACPFNAMKKKEEEDAE